MGTANQSFENWVLDYERVVREANADDFLPATVVMVDGIGAFCSKGGLVEREVPASAREHWYTRAASAMTKCITDRKTKITLPQMRTISRRKQAIAYIFAASGYRGMTHLMDQMKSRQHDGRQTINPESAVVLLAFLGIDDIPDELMDVALAQPPSLLFYLMLGWLNQRAILTSQGERNRGRLLTSGHLLEGYRITDQDIPSLINAWMYSSYASEPSKHDIKIWFNSLLVDHLKNAGITPRPVIYTRKARPKIMVILERFTSEHAMYRCYAPMIRSLSRSFETVAVVETAMIDSSGEALFDSVIKIGKPLPTIEQLAAVIQNQDPDMIYYSSLGMSHWSVMIAALRLAPIQVMTQGHPATSMLETMDFVYLTRLKGDPGLIHSEKVITSPTALAFEGHSDLSPSLPKLLPASLREVRIAVNSKVMKLSWRLLDVCKRLQREANVTVKFTFFPGERLALMDGIDAAIRTHLPSATVEPYVTYSKFLDQLCKCDMALASFPFGNTNSTVDACLLGLPTVAHFGPESPAQTDALVLETAGLPSWLVCHDDEEYFQTALALVNDPQKRMDAMAGLDREILLERLTTTHKSERTEPFGEVLYRLHRSHSTMQLSTQRTFDYREILGLDD